MRKDTSFSDRKLTTEEFAQKYWLDGDAPYQFHSAKIEDGRDEREQFLINDVMALADLHQKIYGIQTEMASANSQRLKRSARLTAISLALSFVACVWVAISYFI